MKLLRVGARGAERPAVLTNDHRVLDVTAVAADFDATFFATGGVERLRAHLADAPADLPELDTTGLRIAAPIAKPSQVVGIGLNYAGHAAEADLPLPVEPVMFLQSPGAVTGPYDDVFLPPGGTKVDWEVELAVVIGRRARYLKSASDAASCIAGYAVSNDITDRGFQFERGGQWTKGKSSETFNPLGPWLVTTDEIADPQDLEIWLRVNGEVRQQSCTRDMIFDVAELVRYVSQFLVLEPGDVINTGTAAGVGFAMDPPQFLNAGDVIELGIQHLGAQRQRCVRPGAA